MMALIEGVKINMGGRDFVAPPLNFKALRALTPKLVILSAMGDVPTGEQIDVVLDVVHAALVRNYPDLTRDELEELLDLANLASALVAIMGASGLEKTSGEASGPPVADLTGATSTGS
jgi:hypothetical protein